jgi:SAM-dependent methyltransferase
MATTVSPAQPALVPLTDNPRVFLVAIGLSSFAALLLELVLTRLFSVVLFYHFAFLAISIALLGLGAGGVFAYIYKDRLNRTPTRDLAARLCCWNAVAIPSVLEIILHVPVSLELSWYNLLKLTVLYLAAAVPFSFTGILFSVVFARQAGNVTRLYGADLLGGALACLGTVPLLNWLGGPNSILAAAAIMAAAALLWATSSATRKTAGLLAGLAAALILANYSGRFIDVIYAKGVLRDKSWVEFARWNAISRVEVDRQGEGGKAIVIDADASTYIMNVDPHGWQGTDWQKNLMAAPPALANVLRPRGEFAIIGPGGGVDVLRAVANGSPSVTGIEINPIIADTIMRGRYAAYTYHLYERPEVNLQVTDGRSFVRNAKQTFDVVQMTLVDTWASTAAGAFALSENSLYTANAFREYFRHLKPDGMIAITRWEFRQPREALRVVSVATEALHQIGVANPARHFIVVSQGALDEDGIAVVVLAKKSPFTAEEEARIYEHLDDNPDLVALYTPSSPGQNPFSDLIARNDPWAFAREYPYNVAPVDDDSPFFFFTLKTDQILHDGGLQKGIDWKVNLGVVVLGIVFLISIAAVVGFLLVPMALRGGRMKRSPAMLYFVAVGLGYILVEISCIQRFVLFLGHPTYALTVVIFLLLLSSGAGSLLSRRWLSQAARGWIPLLVLILGIALSTWALPGLLGAFIGVPFAMKLLLSAVVLVPLGFAMGMPFPTGLRALAGMVEVELPAAECGEPINAPDNSVEWAWAMNAASSVLGSVLAMVIAIHFGLNVTLACGAVAYLLAFGLFPTLATPRS